LIAHSLLALQLIRPLSVRRPHSGDGERAAWHQALSASRMPRETLRGAGGEAGEETPGAVMRDWIASGTGTGYCYIFSRSHAGRCGRGVKQWFPVEALPI